MWFKRCKFRQHWLLSTENYKSRFCSCQNHIDIHRDKRLTTSTLLSQVQNYDDINRQENPIRVSTSPQFPGCLGKFADLHGRPLRCPGTHNFTELITEFCSVSGGKKEYSRIISQITFPGGIKSLEVSKGNYIRIT